MTTISFQPPALSLRQFPMERDWFSSADWMIAEVPRTHGSRPRCRDLPVRRNSREFPVEAKASQTRRWWFAKSQKLIAGNRQPSAIHESFSPPASYIPLV